MFARAKWSLVVIPILVIGMIGFPIGIQADQCQGYSFVTQPIPPDQPVEGIPNEVIRKYITGIQVTPNRLHFGSRVRMLPLNVIGILSIARPGDVTVDLTDGSMGTQYFTGDSSVVEVTTNGLVLRRGPGNTFVTVKFGSYTKIVNVQVDKT